MLDDWDGSLDGKGLSSIRLSTGHVALLFAADLRPLSMSVWPTLSNHILVRNNEFILLLCAATVCEHIFADLYWTFIVSLHFSSLEEPGEGVYPNNY